MARRFYGQKRNEAPVPGNMRNRRWPITRGLLGRAVVLAALAASAAAGQGAPETAGGGHENPVGERLHFRIDWDPPWYLFFFPNMHAGDAEIFLEGETPYRGRKALKILFRVHSSGTLSKLSGMEINDEFVYLSDPETLCTLSATKTVREGKRKRRIEIEYAPDGRRLHFREYDESVTPAELMKDVVKEGIPPCVRDPLSALYDLRRDPFDAGSARTCVVGDNDAFREVETRVEKQVLLDTAAGKIPAWKIRTASLMGGLFRKGGDFTLWLSADDRQVPLRFEAKVSLGHVLGRLEETASRPAADAR